MKPVVVRGIFDHTREFMVKKMYRGEKGVQIITPFYTHLNAEGKEQAILVNRGWVPEDLKDQHMHQQRSAGKITGVLYRGDAKTKYSLPNDPTIGNYRNVTPYDFATVAQLPNGEEASQFMLHQVDMDEEKRQLLPTCPTISDLTSFRISPERHAAYESLWRAMTFVGVVANTAVWLYF